MRRIWLVLLFALAALLVAVVRAQDATPEETIDAEADFGGVDISEELAAQVASQLQRAEKEGEQAAAAAAAAAEAAASEIPEPHPHVTTVAVLPKYGEEPTPRFPLGEVVEIICGFRNRAVQSLNITRITGSLNFVQDFRYAIQNFSAMEFGQTVVPPGVEVSIAYPIRPDPALEPRDFQVAAIVWYEDPDTHEEFASTCFNQTVELVEKASSFDSGLVFSIVAVLAIVAVIAALGYRALAARVKKGKRASRVETGTADAGTVQHDFISDIVGTKSPARSKTPKKTSAKND